MSHSRGPESVATQLAGECFEKVEDLTDERTESPLLSQRMLVTWPYFGANPRSRRSQFCWAIGQCLDR
jgi:hypothetical protein